ncbi:helix-turn-helix domain-containing protein [Halorussus gelatinilyticus]|uniref:Helix-turn-helix domain-containing protein n=1 Tax=Halorussus gelatinilyticus TaxID=2937524 RepID=A0A8U0IDJ9_9EURY|nr:bacterio-opsin activator domain-containing protein [Halorussus gelatinilyticus]UPV99012.1 helix-turn-helix domain-containing protein [Halorussus gelatinilyticus]
MSVLTAFTVPGDDFLLGWTLERAPEMQIEIERVAVEDESVTPYFWVAGEDFERFEAALADDPTVDRSVELEDHGDQRLYQVAWKRDAKSLVYAVSEVDATILQAESDGTDWSVELLFPDDEAVSALQDYAAAHDLSFELRWLHDSAHPEAFGQYEVTDEQREALVTAYRLGYFEVPGEVSLGELADELDISKNAASARLHRGYANLVENTLVHDE